MLRVLVVLLSLLCVVYTSQPIRPLEQRPEKLSNVPGCYIADLDQVIPFGQAAPDRKSCMEYSCGETFISYNTCAAVHAEKPYEVVEDKTKLFPDCCPKIRRIPRKI